MFVFKNWPEKKIKILLFIERQDNKIPVKADWQRKTASFHPNWTSFYQPPTVQQIAELIWVK